MSGVYHLLNIRRVGVMFPFVAYKCQLEYMEKVIQSLQEGKNALLDSPTGTGKTLCLLSAVLAWRETLKVPSELVIDSQGPVTFSQVDLPLIVYASRTHSQLSQVIKELNKTPYAKLVNGAVFGSRAHLCVNPTVSSSKFVSQKCSEVVRHGKCSFYHGFIAATATHASSCSAMPVSDIEDLVKLGVSTNVCPYFSTRERQRMADILFVPYNYIVDSVARESMLVNFQGSVIIIDEAHNISSVACESNSWEISTDEIEKSILFIKGHVDTLSSSSDTGNGNDADSSSDTGNRATISQCTTFRDLIRCLEKLLHNLRREDVTPKDPKVFPGPFLLTFLESCDLTVHSFETYARVVDDILYGGSFTLSNGTHSYSLRRLIDTFKRVFFVSDPVEFASKFRVIIRLESTSHHSSAPLYKLQHWCFDPSPAIAQLVGLGVRNLILTSGTLFPFDFYTCELLLPFPICLKAQHVIDKSQIWVGALSRAVDGTILNSSYSQRSDKYMSALGWTIINITRISPGGILVFFPSYAFMEECLENWRQKISGSSLSIWEGISNYKYPVQEPRDSSKLTIAINKFYAQVNQSKNGAIFYAVCRGKVSEGLDFSNSYSRTVIMVGLPYTSSMDLRVRLRKEFLDEMALKNLTKTEKCKSLTGAEWYMQTSWNAVNQAVGRIIRNSKDYGAIIFADERYYFGAPYLSKWLLPHLKKYDSTVPMFASLSNFFEANAKSATQLKTESDSVHVDTPFDRHFLSKNGTKRPLSELLNRPPSEIPEEPANPRKCVPDTANEKVLEEMTSKAKDILKLINESATPEEWKDFRDICFLKKNQKIDIRQFFHRIERLFAEKLHLADALKKCLVFESDTPSRTT